MAKRGPRLEERLAAEAGKQIIEAYKNGKTVLQIAQEHDASRFTMHKVMDLLGIKRRPPGSRVILNTSPLYEELKKLNMSLPELADTANVPYTYLLKIAKNKTRVIKLDLILRVLEVFQMKDDNTEFLNVLANSPLTQVEVNRQGQKMMVDKPLQVEHVIKEKMLSLGYKHGSIRQLAMATGLAYSTLNKNFNQQTSLNLESALKIFDTLKMETSPSIEFLRSLLPVGDVEEIEEKETREVEDESSLAVSVR